MKRSYLIAGLLAVAAGAWIVSGQLDGSEGDAPARKPPVDLTASERVPSVRVRAFTAEPFVDQLVLRGRSQAERKIELSAEVNGRLAEMLVEEGEAVREGAVVARIEEKDRAALLGEAKALREQRRIEYEAARKLSAKGYRATTQVAAAKAAYEAAKAAVATAEIALAQTTIVAPFDGVVSTQLAEIGTYLDVGDPILRLVDLDPIVITAQASERDAAHIERDSPARATLITGQAVEGHVRFISPEADEATRTFNVEIEVPNPERALADGVTAEVTVPLREVTAHRLPPSILTLRDDGAIGVIAVTPDATASFEPVTILTEDARGLWVDGLPRVVTLITVGQEFVTVGQSVRPIDEQTLAPAEDEDSESAPQIVGNPS